ncbi:DNA helicase UvrD, partial [Pseudomonas otitidis]|nr:DNA helicase UvrD [Pseudomonas otitidis]
MLSAVKRYTALISGTLVRCFPRTTAYLRAEREAAEAAQALARAQAQQKKARPRGRNKKASEGKGRT